MDKYEEALQKARKLYNGDATNPGRKKWLEEIFPELAESEDDRIRKELIEQVGYLLPDNEEYDENGHVVPAYNKRIKRYRAWLEKQKRKKPISQEDFDIAKHEALWGEQKPAGFYFIDQDGKKYYSKEFKWGNIRVKAVNNEEQKPVEWSEEDYIKQRALIDTLQGETTCFTTNDFISWLKSLCPVKQEFSEEDKEALDMCIDAIPKAWKTKSGILLTRWLKDKLNSCSQPKQEWSEEDKRMYKCVLSLIHGTYVIETQETKDALLSWLKSLRPHLSDEEIKKIRSEEYTKGFNDCLLGKQKGWGDGDEELLDGIIKVVCGIGVQPNGLRDKQVRFLKSLRPTYYCQTCKMNKSHWKPSEEQMKALQNAVALTACDKELVRLYNQLKKL